MSEESAQMTKIDLIRMDDGRWRVFINDEDMAVAYQFPWDALQCAINGSLSGKPLRGLQTITLHADTASDPERLARIRAAQVEQRALLAALRGLDGEGI
ncbi:MAG TPA: hypothetical protein VGB17_12145 [Pyrinomonadaceae bacterium]|jgi:hypothetical protein